MTRNRTGPAAADTASGDVKHVQPTSEQAEDTAGAAPTKGARARDPFLARKDAWLAAAREDKRLGDSGFRALHFLSDHAAIRQHGFTRFGHKRIAMGIGGSVSAARRALANAELCDFLRIKPQTDLGKTNEYWPCLNGAPLTGLFPPELTHPRAQAPGKGCSQANSPPCPELNTPRVLDTDQPGRSVMSSRGAQKRTTTFLNDPPNRTSESVTTKSSAVSGTALLLPSDDKKSLLKAVNEDLVLCSEVLGLPLDGKNKTDWYTDMIALRGKGLEFRPAVAAAMKETYVRYTERREQLKVARITWFQKSAEAMAEFRRQCSVTGEWDRFLAELEQHYQEVRRTAARRVGR